MRGIASIESAVTRRRASSRTRSCCVRGWRNAMSTVSSRRRASSSSDGFCTFTTSSAAYGSPIAAPASAYRRSGKLEASPAPRSTTTVFPLFASRETVSGTRATRRSPGAVSLGTPIFISRRDELLEAGADLGRDAFDGLDVEWLRERDDESFDANPRVGADLLGDLVGGPDERFLRRALAVVLLDALQVAPALRRVVADDAP